MAITRRRFLAVTAGLLFAATRGTANAAGDPTHYELYRTTGPDPTPDDLIATVRARDIDQDPIVYQDTGRAPGRAYCYWVRYIGGGPPRLTGPAVAVAV